MPTLVQTLVAIGRAPGNMAGQRNCLFGGSSWGPSLHSWRTGGTENIVLGSMITRHWRFTRSEYFHKLRWFLPLDVLWEIWSSALSLCHSVTINVLKNAQILVIHLPFDLRSWSVSCIGLPSNQIMVHVVIIFNHTFTKHFSWWLTQPTYLAPKLSLKFMYHASCPVNSFSFVTCETTSLVCSLP